MMDDGSGSDRLQRDWVAVRCRRLLFRCWHRGTQESDLVLGRFAEAHLAGFDSAQLDRFDALLDCSDPDLIDWITGQAPPPPEHNHDVIRLMCSYVNRTTAD
jgi:antitoxin CptB